MVLWVLDGRLCDGGRAEAAAARGWSYASGPNMSPSAPAKLRDVGAGVRTLRVAPGGYGGEVLVQGLAAFSAQK